MESCAFSLPADKLPSSDWALFIASWLSLSAVKSLSEVLSDFVQGRQPDGAARKVKFKINKNNIDNFVVFRYSYGE